MNEVKMNESVFNPFFLFMQKIKPYSNTDMYCAFAYIVLPLTGIASSFIGFAFYGWLGFVAMLIIVEYLIILMANMGLYSIMNEGVED